MPLSQHVIGNEQELNRKTLNVDMDNRALHELYLWPFADAIQADVASLMCSYNKFKGKSACESDELLNGIVKQGLEFQGYIVRISDEPLDNLS